MVKVLLQKILRFGVYLIVFKYKPKIIGITGSVGKTSTKEAIAVVLESEFRVRKSCENNDNKIGLLFTVIGIESLEKNILFWLKVFWKIGELLIIKDRKYPEILVLEMATEKEGDLEFFTEIIKCDIGIITAISHVNLNSFKTVEAVQKEKSVLIENLKKGAWAILNYDDSNIEKISYKSKEKIFSYGSKKGNSLELREVKFNFSALDADSFLGVNFKIFYEGSLIPVSLPNNTGYNAVYASLAAIATGLCMDMNLIEVAQNLKKFHSLPGRMNLIKGIKDSIILDDTYNSLPRSNIRALNFLENIKSEGRKKIVVLADMSELGTNSDKFHQEIGEHLVGKVDILFAFGEKSKFIIAGAIKNGMNKDNLFHFTNFQSCLQCLREKINKGDVVLVKGSRSMKMEKLVKEIMKFPDVEKDFLVS